MVKYSEYKAVEKFGEIQKDEIKSSKINSYSKKGNLIESIHNTEIEHKLFEISTYDEKSRIIEYESKSSYNTSETSTGKETYKYDESNNITEHNVYRYGILFYKEIYKNDILIKKKEYHKEDLWNIYIYEYDAGGNEIEVKKYYIYKQLEQLEEYKSYLKRKSLLLEEDGYLGVLSEIHITKYDENGNKIEKKGQNDDGDLVFKTTYKYDENNNMTEEKRLEDDGGLDYKFTYKYDENGIIIKRAYTDGDNFHRRTTYFRYDENGNMIEQKWHGKDGSLYFKETYKYDENGNKINTFSSSTDDSFYRRTFFGNSKHYKYDSLSNEIEKKWDFEPNHKYIYKYDNNNSLIEKSCYTINDSLYFRQIYKYDENGNVIENSCYDADGGLDYKYTYTYKFDDEGNMIVKNRYNEKGVMDFKYKHDYDNAGNEIVTSSYNADGGLDYTDTNSYDNAGNKTVVCHYNYKDSLVYIDTNYYDAKHNLIESKRFNKSGSLKDNKHSYEFEFDKKGNWTRKIVFKDNLPTIFHERIIDYYD